MILLQRESRSLPAFFKSPRFKRTGGFFICLRRLAVIKLNLESTDAEDDYPSA